MKLQVTQENLNRALSSVARVASTRGTLPILSNVLLKTHKNRLSISATNLDIAITHYTGAKVSEEGSITIPARLMQDFVSSLPSEVITLDLDENKLHINTENYQSTINGTNAEDFPVMPAITKGTSWSIPAAQLKQGLQQVIFAASNDESRPVLTGIYMHTYQKSLYIVATDSYRLAEKKLSKIDQDVSLLLPASALQDLLRIITDNDTDVHVTHDDQQVLFKTTDVELVARLIEGNYPDYRKLIPKGFENTATLAKSELLNITKVSSLFARESAGSVTLNLNGKKGEISIRSIASQLGENTASASAEVGGDGAITLNSRYIMDALQALEGDQAQLGFNGKVEPSLISDPRHKDYQHIIMPLKS